MQALLSCPFDVCASKDSLENVQTHLHKLRPSLFMFGIWPCMWCCWYFTSSESHNLVSLQLSPNSSKRSHTKNNTHRPILYFGCNKSIGPSNTSCGSNNFIVHKIEIMSVHRNIFKISVVWKQEETQISLPFRLFPIPTPPDPPPTRNNRPRIWRSPMVYLRWKNN